MKIPIDTPEKVCYNTGIRKKYWINAMMGKNERESVQRAAGWCKAGGGTFNTHP